jgi:glycerophosphoryl diester phosphodiesterase
MDQTRARAVASANPESFIRAGDGRLVELKVHRALWSGSHRENSLAALRECYEERVARAEIDLLSVGDDFVVSHDRPRRGAKPPTLRDVVAIVRASDGPTLLMLDAKDEEPWPRDAVMRLLRLIEPVRDRVYVGSPSDWNLRRLHDADTAIAIAFDPQYYLTTSLEHLAQRLDSLRGLVPAAREMHLPLRFFEGALANGFNAAAFLHERGMRVDVWTIHAGSPASRTRAARAVAAGVDVITTDAARAIARALSGSPRSR